MITINYGKFMKSIEESAKDKTQAEKRGKWIPYLDGKFVGGAYWYKCSECGRVVAGGLQSDYNYCPNCGADMREEECVN